MPVLPPPVPAFPDAPSRAELAKLRPRQRWRLSLADFNTAEQEPGGMNARACFFRGMKNCHCPATISGFNHPRLHRPSCPRAEN